METKLILTDIDECVVRYHESFEIWVRNNPVLLRRLGVWMPPENSHLHLKQDMEEWLEVDNSKVSILIDLFARSESFRNIPPGWESDIYIPLLSERGFKFVAITSAGSSSIIKESRIQNLETYFPDMFTAVHCIDWEDSKENYLKLYQPTWWIEDRIPNAEMGLKYCHKPFIIDNTHNHGKLPEGMKRVTSWKGIYECITNDDCNLMGWMC